MSDTPANASEFISMLPPAPAPKGILQQLQENNDWIDSVAPLETRDVDGRPFIYDFTISINGTRHGLRFADEAWDEVTNSEEVDDVKRAMRQSDRDDAA